MKQQGRAVKDHYFRGKQRGRIVPSNFRNRLQSFGRTVLAI